MASDLIIDNLKFYSLGETFPVLKEIEEKEYSEYRTRRLVFEALKRFSRPTVKVHIKNRDLYFCSKKYNLALQNCIKLPFRTHACSRYMLDELMRSVSIRVLVWKQIARI